MPGRIITIQQYGIYMQARKLGHTQRIAAAKAGICERTGRSLEKEKIPFSNRSKRGRKPGHNIFSGVWDSVIVPLLERDHHLSAVIVLEHLQDLYPDNYTPSNLRTLQRLLQEWRALYGPEKEVMFRQYHQPGLQGLSDFTVPKNFKVTIQGKAFDHRLYHFRLAYSGWSYMHVIQGGESFMALSQGLQNALWHLGGCPKEHRTDSLSAAYKNGSTITEKDFTKRYEHLCHHYALTATRNNLGKSHENGSIESPHGHLKRRIAQTLILRGSCNFESILAYQQFIDAVVECHNKRHKKKIDEERHYLTPLPKYRTIDFEETTARVSTFSTILVRNVVYSVPSRLIGQRLHIHLYAERLACYLGSEHVLDAKRIKTIAGRRQHCIDYHHLIHSLSRKPQAFRYSVFREEILPSLTYKHIWTLLDQMCMAQQACKLMVGILKIAADYNCEQDLGQRVLSHLQKGQVPNIGMIESIYKPKKVSSTVPDILVSQHSLATYNQLLPSFLGGQTHA